LLNKTMKPMQKGFSLVELLVSLAIFSVVIVSILSIFTHSQWLYVASEGRSNAQDNARLAMEQVERDLRLVGLGVSRGVDVTGGVSGASPWMPAIFYASATEIGYRAESNNQNTQLTANAPEATNTRIHVARTSIGTTPFGLVLARRGMQWQALTALGVASDANGPYFDLGAAVNAGGFAAKQSQVFTLEHVFYQYIGNASPPFGTIRKAVVSGNTITSTFPASSAFNVIASNIVNLQFQYFSLQGTALTGFPLSVANRTAVARIVVTITARDRHIARNTYQDVTLTAEVLIRNRAL